MRFTSEHPNILPRHFLFSPTTLPPNPSHQINNQSLSQKKERVILINQPINSSLRRPLSSFPFCSALGHRGSMSPRESRCRTIISTLGVGGWSLARSCSTVSRRGKSLHLALWYARVRNGLGTRGREAEWLIAVIRRFVGEVYGRLVRLFRLLL